MLGNSITERLPVSREWPPRTRRTMSPRLQATRSLAYRHTAPCQSIHSMGWPARFRRRIFTDIARTPHQRVTRVHTLGGVYCRGMTKLGKERVCPAAGAGLAAAPAGAGERLLS